MSFRAEIGGSRRPSEGDRSVSPLRLRWLPAAIGGGCLAVLVGLEVAEQDVFSVPDLLADLVNLILTVGAAAGVGVLFQRMQAQHEERLILIQDLQVARIEGNAWRARVQGHLAGLKIELDRQFNDWGMTAAESEIGLLILKGLSHKEIATLRATSDATVRQQAQSIYRKARLPGRTAFSAYFLDDLFGTDASTSATSGRADRTIGVQPAIEVEARSAGE